MELMPIRGFDKGRFPLQREMNRLFDDFFTGSRWADSYGGVAGFPLDLFENEEEIVVAAEVPGVERDDLEVTVTGNTVTITGEKKALDQGAGEARQRERTYGRFSRSFSLPESVDTSRVHAELTNGILTLRLAKREETKPRAIEVTVG